MSNNDLQIFCVTNKALPFLEKTKYNLAGVGQNNFNSNYIKSDSGENIFYKGQYYSELVLKTNFKRLFVIESLVAYCTLVFELHLR